MLSKEMSMSQTKKKMTMWLFLVILTLPHLNPDYFNTLPLVDKIVNSWRLLSFLVIVIGMFLKRRMTAITALVCI